MQELIVFLETPESTPQEDSQPHFGSPEKICNAFLNRCVIDEEASFEVQYISYLKNFAEVEDSVRLLLQKHFEIINIKANICGLPGNL